MPISATIRSRIKILNDLQPDPDRLARYLFNQGIRATPNSDTDGILQTYLESVGISASNLIVKGFIIRLATDDDRVVMLRLLSVFIYLFDQGKYPLLIAEAQ
jgi:hypothetical protein